MNVEEAESWVRAAERELHGCDVYLQEVLANWREAEKASRSNKHHYRLRRRYGDNYRSKLKEDKDIALTNYNKAEAEVVKAKAAYEKAKKA